MTYGRATFRQLALLLLLLLFVCGHAFASAEYLPLKVGTRWVLKHPGMGAPVVIEVVAKNGNTFRVKFSHPWGENEWDLQTQGNKVYMTAYGANGNLAPMPANTLFFSFAGDKNESWTNAIGKLSVVNSHLAVRAGSANYPDCIEVKQVSGSASFYYAFASGIGFVQFGEGKDAFLLDTSQSTLPASVSQGPGAGRSSTQISGTSLAVRPGPAQQGDHQLHIGITASTFANEPSTPQNLLMHFDQISQAGITFLSSAQKWPEIETAPGRFNLQGLDFQIGYANRLNIPMSVTLRLIDTVDRVMPNDLKHVSWDSPAMQGRVLPMVDAMASHFQGRVKWFMFGNEIDGYFSKHTDEIQPFTRLLVEVKKHVYRNAPGTLVGSTLMFGGIDSLSGPLAPLNAQFDFLAFTYYPIRGNFTMRDPDVVFADFNRMHQIAAGRKVVLQEIGYPSSPLNDSSEEKQARFYANVFQAMRKDREFIEAGNLFLLADLPDKFVKDLAGFYGMPNQKVFLTYLQTLGLFDLQGRPKKSWDVVQSELGRERSRTNRALKTVNPEEQK
jgi:hypothetical protein